MTQAFVAPFQTMPVRRNRAAKGKNSTPRVDEKARSVTNPTTKDLVKVAFFFDESDDEDQFPDGSSFLGGLSPIRGVHGRPNMLLSPANASTFSIPSEPLKPKNQIAPYRFIMPKHLLKRPLASLSTNTFAKPNATKVSVFEATKRQKLKEKPKPAPSKSKANDTQEKENNSNVQQSNVEKVKVSEPEAKKAAAPRNAFTVLQEKKTAKPAPRRTTRAAKKKTTPPKEEKLHQSKIFEVIENEERVPVKQLRSRKKKAPAVEEPDTEEEAELDEEYRE